MVAAAGVRAQDAIITAENADQVVELERFGKGAPRQVVFAPDARRLAVATSLGVWVINPPWWREYPTGATLFTFAAGDNATGASIGAASAAFSADGGMIAAGGDDGGVMVWDAASGQPITRLENHIYPVGAVAWSGDGSRLATGDDSGVMRLWDTAMWTEAAVYNVGSSGAIRALAFAEDGQSLNGETAFEPITVHFDTGEVQFWSGVRGSYLNPPYAVRGDKAAWIAGETLHITQAGREVDLVGAFFGAFRVVFYQPNGQIAARADGSAWFWVRSSGGAEGEWQPVGLAEIDPAISPDGTRTATFGNDGVIRLTDTATGSEIAALYGHIRAVTAVAWSPDGRLLASSSNDGTVRLWDATISADSGELAALVGHNGGVADVAWSPDGTRLASAGYDGTVRTWGVG